MSLARGAFTDAFRVDLTRTAPWAGILRAVPVVVLFAFGLGVGSTQTALTLGIGANLVAIVSLVGEKRPRPTLLVFVVLGIALATFVGSVTASDEALHLAVLSVWCFGAGLLVTFGLGPATTGVQSVIVFVVFGRFADTPIDALGLAGLVAAGAALEGLTVLTLRLPPTFRAQRASLTTAWRALGELAHGDVAATAVATAEAFDQAAADLATPALFGRTDVQGLRSLVDEGRRIRLELAGVMSAQRQLDRRERFVVRDTIDEVIARAEGAIKEIADATDHLEPLRPSSTAALRLADAVQEAHRTLASTSSDELPVLRQCLVHVDALAGQIRAARHLLEAPNEVDRRHKTPSPQRNLAAELKSTVEADLAVLRANLTPHSSAFRHAVRLAVAVPGAALLANALSLPRGYWVAFTVAAVLRPDYSSLFRRGIGRVLGTVLGATVAALIVGGLHPDKSATIALVAATAWAAYTLWQANFAIAIAFLTALVLVLLSALQTDTVSTALDRLIDTAVGGTIALVTYVAWPTWSGDDARHDLARLARAHRAYLTDTYSAAFGLEILPGVLSNRARDARLAWAQAESAIGRSMDEPPRHRIDPEFSSGCLAALRRIVQTLHSVRVATERGLHVPPSLEMRQLVDDLAASLEAVAEQLDNPRHGHAEFGLRGLYAKAVASLSGTDAPAVIAVQLDELVDAINTLSGVVADHGTGRRDPGPIGDGDD